jgi:hypothetical protein
LVTIASVPIDQVQEAKRRGRFLPSVQARYLDNRGNIGWKASPRFLTKLADAKRDAQDELEDFS